MILDGVVHEVTITITARRTTAIDTGKGLTESKTYIVTDFMTELSLQSLVDNITPTT